jgi:hypothetical protein
LRFALDFPKIRSFDRSVACERLLKVDSLPALSLACPNTGNAISMAAVSSAKFHDRDLANIDFPKKFSVDTR